MGFDQDFLIQDISLDGFEIVKGQYFSKKTEPAMTMWNTAVSFNSATFSAFGNCECIQIMVNNAKKQIIIKPSNSKEENTINWRKRPSEPMYCRLECALFTRRLFEAWKLDDACRYRMTGKLVQYQEKLMILFSFQNSETWKGKKLLR